MNKYLIFLLSLGLLSCSTQKTNVSRDWKKDSDKISRAYSESMAALDPERYDFLRLVKYSSMVTSFSKNYDQERYVTAYKWEQKFLRFLDKEKNPELINDVNILLDTTRLQMQKYELVKEAGMVPFLPLTKYIHDNIKANLQPAAAMTRFRKYVRGEGNQLPLFDGYTSFMLFRMNYLAENKKRGFWPVASDIEKYIETSDNNLSAIEKLLSGWKTDEWKRDFEELKNQDQEFRKFLRKKVIPYCRPSFVTISKVYALYLKNNEIESSPEAIIQIGQTDYKNTYKDFLKYAAIVAGKLNLPSKQPAYVMQTLKDRAAKNNDEILKTHLTAVDWFINIVRENNLISVDNKPEITIRFAFPDEARNMNGTHFQVPSLLSKERPLIVVFPRLEDSKGMDDFVFPEVIYTQVAHEALPGHALQFERVMEKVATSARVDIGLNSAKAAAWATTSDRMIFPYVSDELKFVFLQRKLLEEARMFLDPQLNLGQIQPEQIIELLTRELGFSEAFAQSEVGMYRRAPGMAPADHYSFKLIQEIKAKVKNKLGNTYVEKCFNDGLLNSGLIPFRLLTDHLMKNQNCGNP